jgi:hypothetical protein
MQPQHVVKVIERSASLFPVVPVIAYQATHYRPVSLLDMRLIIFLVSTRTSELQPFCLAIVQQSFVNELGTIVGIQPKQQKWQPRTNFLYPR